MRSLSSVGLGLSVVFTCLLLALVAEIYYLLWWKRRIITREIIEDDYTTSSSRKSSYMLCSKNQASPTVNISTSTQIHQELFHFHPQNGNSFGEELIIGPPRFLFTIREETKEEMESSEEGKFTNERKRKSLNDLMKNMDIITPNVTPLPSPPLSSCHYNPLYESSNDVEFNRVIVKSSPPSKFKFLRNAEEKLVKKTMLMEQVKREKDFKGKNNERVDGSFITIIVANNNIENDDKPNNSCHSPIM